jgi:hypothetical protein
MFLDLLEKSSNFKKKIKMLFTLVTIIKVYNKKLPKKGYVSIKIWQ